MKIQDILQLVKWLVYICLFVVPFVPLIVSNSLFFPFIVGKGLAFRVFTELALGGWLLLVLFGDMPKPRITPMVISIGIFVAVVALADAVGVAPFKSVWSNFERMDGLVTIVHSAVFFLIAGNMLNTHKLWLRFWQVSLVVSMIVGFGALGELGKEGVRIAGTTGNPIYLAVYALFHMFVAMLLMRKSDDTVARWAYGVSITFNLMVLWFTGTRGALLGLIAGVAVMVLGIVFFGRSVKRWVKISAITGLVLLAILGGTFMVFKDSDFVQHNTMLHRLTELGNLDETDHSTSALRLMVWKTALKGVKERPILGWGQENFNYVFNKYHNPHMYWAEAWYDRTHNILMDWLISAGVLGLLAYLAMYGVIFVESVRARYFDSIESSILAGLLAAYAVHNLFVFDHIISYILFFSLAAWLYSADSIERDDESYIADFDGTMLALLSLIIIPISTIAIMYYVNYPSYIQNKNTIDALVSMRNVKDINKAKEYFLSATNERAIGTQEAREQFIQAANRLASNKNVNQKDKKAFVNEAMAQMQEQVKLYPQDARFPYFIAGALKAYGDNEKATPFLKKALALSPTKVNFLIALANNLTLRGDVQKAQEYYKKAKELAPEDARLDRLIK